MPVSVEWIRPDVGIARGGPDHRAYGDPFVSVMTLDGKGDTVICKGLIGPVTRQDWREIESMIAMMGFAWMEYDRMQSRVAVRRVRKRVAP